MSEIVLFVQTCWQALLAVVFAAVLLLMLVNQFRLLRRTRKLQRNIDGIAGKVREYLAVVMEPEEEQEAGGESAAEANARNEEEDSRLVSAVLQEIFP